MKNSISRRSFLKAVGALSAAGALAACGGSSSSSTAASSTAASAAASTAAGANIKLWTYPIGGWGKDETVQELISSFNAKYPDIKVTVEYLDYTNGDDQVNTAIEGGSAPDLIMEGPERLVANWGKKGVMAPLNDLWTDDAKKDIYASVESACRNEAGDYYEYPLCMTAYKAINTMDSMLGYKNEKYLYFGRIPAKLDDAANYLPSRLAALLWVAAAAFTHNDAKGAWKIWRRDRRNHASPNSAQTESACAGALGVQLAGPAYYFGEYYAKPTIGDPLRPIEPEDILRANRMMYVASAFALAWGVAIRAIL